MAQGDQDKEHEAARKLQARVRGGMMRANLALTLQTDHNKLLSMPGTIQGHSGYYNYFGPLQGQQEHGAGVVFFQIDPASGAWNITEGPMTLQEYKAKATKSVAG